MNKYDNNHIIGTILFLVHDYYKGNRFRNAVVREDFPTALQEQIKEKKSADHQTEIYRRKLKEQ